MVHPSPSPPLSWPGDPPVPGFPDGFITRAGRSPFLRMCLPRCVGAVTSAHTSFETGSAKVCTWEDFACVSYGPAWVGISVFVSMGPGGRAL